MLGPFIRIGNKLEREVDKMKKKIHLEKHNKKNTSYDIVVKDTLVYENKSGFPGEVYSC